MDIAAQPKELQEREKSIEKNVAAAYAALQANGATLPKECNIENLASCITGAGPGEGDGTDWGTLSTTNRPEGIILASSDQYAALNVNDTGPILIDNESIPRKEIIGYSFGRKCRTTGQFFLRDCTQLSKITHLEQLGTAGDGFLYGCSGLNTALDFSSLEECGYNFLGGCKNLNSPVRFPMLRKLGSGFMSNCPRFEQKLFIPSSVHTISWDFLSGCANFVGPIFIESSAVPANQPNRALCTNSAKNASYAVGVLLQGPGAKAWKGALPDAAESGGSGRYRKLILDPEWA